MHIKTIIQSIFFVFITAHASQALCMLGAIRSHDQQQVLNLQELNAVEQDSVNTFNQHYSTADRQRKTQRIKNIKKTEARDIAMLIETSEPVSREKQAYFIVELVGDKPQAHDIFKNMHSGRAVKKAREALKLVQQTKGRLSKSDAFLLRNQQHALCNHILNNTEQRGDKKYLLMDATTYNNIAQLPPHVKKAVGKNVIGIVEKTFEEKLVNIGTCTIGGALSGAVAGYTVNGLAKDPDFLKQSVKGAYPKIIGAATDVLLQESVTFKSDKITALLEDPNPIKHEHIIDEKILSLFKESIQVNDLKAACKSAANTAARETYKTLAPDVLAFDHQLGKNGAFVGALAGGAAGFAYGAYQATKPTKQFEISKMKSYKNQ